MPSCQHYVSPLVEEILSRHRYFGDGPPHWRTRRTDRPCQSARDAENRRWRLLKRLRRYERQTGDEAASSLIDAPSKTAIPGIACGSGEPVLNAARAMQRWLCRTRGGSHHWPERRILMAHKKKKRGGPYASTTDLSTGNPTSTLKRPVRGRAPIGKSAGSMWPAIEASRFQRETKTTIWHCERQPQIYAARVDVLFARNCRVEGKLDRFFRWFSEKNP